MFCKKTLGTNEVLEEFPVGRRLAFDAAKGRLWVICRRCQRWNLTPLEERWEAIEACEELFRGTRVRMSTENIGLARHREGLELVRIGEPLRPEFAAWRYGDQFGKRFRRRLVTGTVAGAALAGGIALGGVAAGVLGVTGASVASLLWLENRPVVRFRPSDGRVRRLSLQGRFFTLLQPADDEIGFRVRAPGSWIPLSVLRAEWHEGDDARRALNAILPSMNGLGSRRKQVQSAVSQIESHGHPSRFLRELPRWKPAGWAHEAFPLFKIPGQTRLAFEMALQEEDERRALEGELWRLERAWREAEEIAAISDNLLLPKEVEDFVAGRRGAERLDGDDSGD